jgi:hypothetical protein
MAQQGLSARGHHVVTWPDSTLHPLAHRAGVFGTDRDVNEHRVIAFTRRNLIGVEDLVLRHEGYEADSAETAAVEPTIGVPELGVTGAWPAALLLPGMSDWYDRAPSSVASVHAPAPSRSP